MPDQPDFYRTVREAVAHLRAWRKIGLSLNSIAFEEWEAEMGEALRGLLAENHAVSIQVSSLIDGIKRRVKLGMSDDSALAALILAKQALEIAEENPPKVRTLGDVDTMIAAQRLYDPSFGRPEDGVVNQVTDQRTTPDPHKVFIVHGRNEKIRSGFFGFLRALGLNPIEWSEAIAATGKASPYVAEALDKAFQNAAAVVVLLTPDDEVRLSAELWSPDEKDDEKSFQMQARPNVLFEAGMSFGRNPDRTLLIEVGSVKRFSDVGGRHVVRLSNDAAKRQEVANRLRTAGCDVSTIGNDWLSSGDFEVTVGTGSQLDMLGVATETVEKIVDLKYVEGSKVLKEMSKAFEMRWCMEPDLARITEQEGWTRTYVIDNGKKVIFRLKDRPFDQFLMMKKKIRVF